MNSTLCLPPHVEPVVDELQQNIGRDTVGQTRRVAHALYSLFTLGKGHPIEWNSRKNSRDLRERATTLAGEVMPILLREAKISSNHGCPDFADERAYPRLLTVIAAGIARVLVSHKGMSDRYRTTTDPGDLVNGAAGGAFRVPLYRAILRVLDSHIPRFETPQAKSGRDSMMFRWAQACMPYVPTLSSQLETNTSLWNDVRLGRKG
jgi:hypothetical protein